MTVGIIRVTVLRPEGVLAFRGVKRKSGEYGGMNRSRAPAFLMTPRTPLDLVSGRDRP